MDAPGSTLTGLDLNLLIVLRALLEERSVTRAARRVGLSQPATSAALARLRRHFHDALLVGARGRYELSPAAEELAEPVRLALVFAERAFLLPRPFDASTADREFRIVASDYAMAILGELLMPLAQRRAPHMRLRIVPITTRAIVDMDVTLRTADLLLMPRRVLPGFPSEVLYRDKWVCVVWSGNPEVGDSISMDDLQRLGEVAMAPLQEASVVVPDLQLRAMGVERRIEVAAESYLVIPYLLHGTLRVCVLQRRLAERLSPHPDVRIVAAPFDLDLDQAMWWHPIHTTDPGHRWLRQLFTDATAPLRASRDARGRQKYTCGPCR